MDFVGHKLHILQKRKGGQFLMNECASVDVTLHFVVCNFNVALCVATP